MAVTQNLLDFGRKPLGWTCRQIGQGSEAFPGGLPHDPTLKHDMALYGTIRRRDLNRTLASIVNAYLRCDLTILMDRAMAVSGIAERPHDDTRDAIMLVFSLATSFNHYAGPSIAEKACLMIIGVPPD